MSQLLAGYRVIETGALLNAASTTMLLADLGADVIKVESPFRGDYLRAHHDLTFLHHQANKAKRSICLDLRTDGGQEVLLRLVATADAFVTNTVADRSDELGIGYEQLRVRKPDLVYCRNTGFGASGPYAGIPTHGQMMDALAGATPVVMGDDGLVRPAVEAAQRRGGTMLSAAEGTMAGALYAALQVAAALAARSRTGTGCYIDVASAAAVVASAWPAALQALGPGPRDLAALVGVARYQYYRTADDRYVLFCPEERKFWVAFCRLVDRSDLEAETHGVGLRRELQAIFATRRLDEWMELAVAHRLPIGPAHSTVEEVRDDPQMQVRGVFPTADEASGLPCYVASPALVSGQPDDVASPAPALGEHTDEILRELGYDDGEIARLARDLVTTALPHGEGAPHLDDVNNAPR